MCWKHTAIACSSAWIPTYLQAHFLKGRASDGKPRPKASLWQRPFGVLICVSHQPGFCQTMMQSSGGMPALKIWGTVQADLLFVPSFPAWGWILQGLGMKCPLPVIGMMPNTSQKHCCPTLPALCSGSWESYPFKYLQSSLWPCVQGSVSALDTSYCFRNKPLRLYCQKWAFL